MSRCKGQREEVDLGMYFRTGMRCLAGESASWWQKCLTQFKIFAVGKGVPLSMNRVPWTLSSVPLLIFNPMGNQKDVGKKEHPMYKLGSFMATRERLKSSDVNIMN